MKLANKVAIVTGAAGAGIGQAVVRAFAKEGAGVVVGDAHAQRPFSVAEDIAATVLFLVSDEARYLPTDVWPLCYLLKTCVG